VRLQLNNRQRQPVLSAEVDRKKPPPVLKAEDGSEIYLHWDRALDDQGYLRQCPACGCRELFVRKDFSQTVGLLIVVFTIVVAGVLFVVRRVVLAFAVLAVVALVDFLAFALTGRRLVCYACRSEFRDLPIRKDHPAWDLAVGEKYRAGLEVEEPAATATEEGSPR
jgi:hypothetical protein